jgi:hypothetical protein
MPIATAIRIARWSAAYHAAHRLVLNDAKHDRRQRPIRVMRDFSKSAGNLWLNNNLGTAAAARDRDVSLAACPADRGFCLPTMTLAHATIRHQHRQSHVRFAPIRHDRRVAKQRVTAVFAVGEGWHNNHHRYQRSARNGFYWWEFDPRGTPFASCRWWGWCGT